MVDVEQSTRTMTQNKDMISWPTAFAIAAVAAAFAVIIWAVSLSDGERYRAQVENNKLRIEHDKWLLENGHIEEPRIR